uniref:Uncharacterized protein n=1 Tax=Strombidium rassoulzadegani TaxID=1082188 RepID=A0A7S3CLT1_9SPIT
MKTTIASVLLLAVALAQTVTLAYNVFDLQKGEDKEASGAQFTQGSINELIRPMITFPESFEMSISTNEYGLNMTEHVYYDKKAQKIRIQIFYSVLGLDSTKGLDIVFDEQNRTVALQTDKECRKTDFGESLLSVDLFFSMFNQLTEYTGHVDGLHHFKIKKLYETDKTSPNFYLIFDEDMQIDRARLEHSMVGEYDFKVLIPITPREFTQNDWIMEGCQQIHQTILREGNLFVSFAWQLIQHLIGSERDLMQFLGYQSSKPVDLDEDEDFED